MIGVKQKSLVGYPFERAINFHHAVRKTNGVLGLDFIHFSIEPDPSSGSDQILEDSRLDSLRSALARFGNVELQMDGAQATIRGTVSSEREKRMAGYLASFEPEIDSVKNELSVQSDR